MIRPSFDIGQNTLLAESVREARLILWISPDWFTASWINPEQESLYRLVTYPLANTADTEIAEQLYEIFQQEPLLESQVRELTVIYQFDDSILLPESGFRNELRHSLLDLFSGNLNQGVVCSDPVHLLDMHTVYRIPQAVYNLFQQKFPTGRQQHYYSTLLRQFRDHSPHSGVQAQVIFFPGKVVIAVSQDAFPLLLQSFQFQTPEDISWLLLHICNKIHIDPIGVTVRLSGLVDIQSASFEEVQKYFAHVELDTIDTDRWQNEALSGYPPHYFAPFLKPALCV